MKVGISEDGQKLTFQQAENATEPVEPVEAGATPDA
jgi:hypothetical protein